MQFLEIASKFHSTNDILQSENSFKANYLPSVGGCQGVAM